MHQLGQRAGFHLAHHLTPMGFHGDLADAQFARHLFVQQAGDHSRHHFAFPSAQQLVAILQHAPASVLLERGTTACDRAANRLQQRFIIEWLGQKIRSAGFHRLHAHGHVGMIGSKNDGQVDTAGCHQLLQVRSAETGQGCIENQAASCKYPSPGEKIVGASKRFHLPTPEVDQCVERRAYREVVVHHEDRGCGQRAGSEVRSAVRFVQQMHDGLRQRGLPAA